MGRRGLCKVNRFKVVVLGIQLNFIEVTFLQILGFIVFNLKLH